MGDNVTQAEGRSDATRQWLHEEEEDGAEEEDEDDEEENITKKKEDCREKES